MGELKGQSQHEPEERLRLLGAARAGDAEAFRALFTPDLDLAWRMALRITGEPASADDALQEGLVSAYELSIGWSLVTCAAGSFGSFKMRRAMRAAGSGVTPRSRFRRTRKRGAEPSEGVPPSCPLGARVIRQGWLRGANSRHDYVRL